MGKKFDLVYARTDRGFHRYEFTDRYAAKCSLQDSSLATESAIWLGINGASIEAVNLTTEEDGTKVAMARMHLTQGMVKDLLPLLQHFAEHGSLPDEEDHVPQGQ